MRAVEGSGRTELPSSMAETRVTKLLAPRRSGKQQKLGKNWP